MLQVFKITGDSLYPFYKNGQRVLCRKVFGNTTVKVNDTIIFKKEKYGLIIKKVTSIQHDGYFVEGTNPLSVDSHLFGAIAHKTVLYKVLFGF
jgi:phage repressor protein C with HTH and peptisase S24 domain